MASCSDDGCLDHCKSCQGTWLDAGELEGYVAHLEDMEENPVMLTPEQTAELARIRQEDKREVQQWVDKFDYGRLNPIFKTIAKLQKSLGLY